jgi:uncharacterized protein (TIGR03435 family)
MGLRVQPGSFNAINVPTALVIQYAYALVNEPGRLIGAPSWVSSDRFDFVGTFKTEDQRQVPRMAQALLADRFKFAAHKESRPMPVYHLVFERDGRPGRGLTPTTSDCSAERVRCGTTMDGGFLAGRGALVSDVSSNLSFLVGRTVIDKTQTDRRFDFRIRFSSERPDGADDSAASIFTVLQEELGLKLIPATEPLDVFVIDRIDRPSED